MSSCLMTDIFKGITKGWGGFNNCEKNILKNGDETVEEEKVVEQEEIQSEAQEETKPEVQEETIVEPIKTTGSVGNFGKQQASDKEIGSMGERLGRLAAVKGEHHYFK